MPCTSELEGGRPTECAARDVEPLLRRLRAAGPTYAIFTRPDGSFLQVGGSAAGCMVEWRDTAGRLTRGYQAEPVAGFTEDTDLQLGDGLVRVRPQEWFRIEQAIELTRAFADERAFPDYASWRDMTAGEEP